MAEVKKQPIQQKQTVIEKPSPVVKSTPVVKKTITAVPSFFDKENYKWMAIGGAIILLGMILMGGGRSQDPNTFDPKVVYSTTRITIAPILIIGGLLVELYAILRRPKQNTNV